MNKQVIIAARKLVGQHLKNIREENNLFTSMFNKVIEIEGILYKVGIVSVEQGVVEIVGEAGKLIGVPSPTFSYKVISGGVKEGDFVLYKIHDEAIGTGPRLREDGTLSLRKAPGVVRFRRYKNLTHQKEGIEVVINNMTPFDIDENGVVILQSFFKDLGYMISEE